MPILVSRSGKAIRSEPLVLAIETAGSHCSVAVARGGEVLATESRPLRHGHGEALLPMIDRVMGEARLLPRALDVIAAAVGPGGFTGIRVGLAAARGIVLAAGARLVGVTGFEAVAHGLYRARRTGSAPLSALLVALDSRREDLYVQLFAPDGAMPMSEPAALLPHRLEEYLGNRRLSAPLLIAGDAAEAAGSALDGRADFEIVPNSAPAALGVLAAALAAIRSDAATESVRPFYLRPPDVTLPKPRRNRAAAAP